MSKLSADIHGLGKAQRALLHRLYAGNLYNCTLDTATRYRMERLEERGLVCKSGAVWMVSVEGAWALDRGLV